MTPRIAYVPGVSSTTEVEALTAQLEALPVETIGQSPALSRTSRVVITQNQRDAVVHTLRAQAATVRDVERLCARFDCATLDDFWAGIEGLQARVLYTEEFESQAETIARLRAALRDIAITALETSTDRVPEDKLPTPDDVRGLLRGAGTRETQ